MRKPLLALSAVAVSALVLAGCSTGGDAAGDAAPRRRVAARVGGGGGRRRRHPRLPLMSRRRRHLRCHKSIGGL